MDQSSRGVAHGSNHFALRINTKMAVSYIFSRRINVSRLIGKRATVCLLAPEEADCAPKVELDAKQLRFIVSRLALTGLAFIFPCRE